MSRRKWGCWYQWSLKHNYFIPIDRSPNASELWSITITKQEISPFEFIFLAQVDAEEGFYSTWGQTQEEAIVNFRREFTDEWLTVDVLQKHAQFYLRLTGPIVARAKIRIHAKDFFLECDRPFGDVEAARRFIKRVTSKREIKKLRPEISSELVII